MKKIVAVLLFVFTAGATDAMAANFAVITSPPTLLNLFVLGAAVGCLVASGKVMSLLRGGQLFKSWQILMVGFVILALSQLSGLLNAFEIVAVPTFVMPALLLIMTGLFLYGVYQAKQTLE